MRITRFPAALLFAAAVIASGCATTGPKIVTIEDPPPLSLIPDSGYYYYTQSQIHRINGDTKKAITFLQKAIDLDPKSIYLKRELAILHLIEKEYRAAETLLTDNLDRKSDDIESLIMLGRMKELLKNNKGVKEIYERVLAVAPKRRDIYLLLGRMYMNDNELAKALALYGRLVANFPDSYAGYFFLGKIHARQGNLPEAEKNFKRSLTIEPALTEPRFELLDIYKPGKTGAITITVKAGDSINKICYNLYQKYTDRIEAAILLLNPQLTSVNDITVGQKIRFPKLDLIKSREEIIGLYNEILAVDPIGIRAKLELALYYHHERMSEEAGKILAELGALSLKDPELLKKVIQYHISEERYDDAVIIITGMLGGAPDSSDLHYLAGVSYDGLKKKDPALNHLLKVRPDSKFFRRAAIHVAFMYQEQDNIDEAILFLEDALEKDPGNMDFMLFLASFYEESGQFEKAADVLDRGLSKDPVNVKFHFRLGVLHDKMDNKAASIEKMKEVIRLDPAHANALNYLGYTYAEQGVNLDEAERLIKEALKHKPDDGYITDSLGWVYYKKGLYQKAVEILEKAATLVTDDPLVFEHLGDAYIKTGNREKALEFYRKSLEMKGEENDGLKKKIEELNEAGSKQKP